MVKVNGNMAERMKLQKRKRKRHNPMIRWSESLTLELITNVMELVKDSPESFEKPTASRFYDKVAADSTMLRSIPCSSMRDKMRHCRNTYIELNKWKQQVGDGPMEDDEQRRIFECMQRKCPHYDELHQIFGHRISIKKEETCFSFDNDHSLSSSCGDANQTPEESPETEVSFANCSYNGQAYENEFKSDQSNNSTLTLLMKIQEDKLHLEREKLNLELQKFEWQKKKEQQELDNQLKFKQMELDHNERLKRFELGLKYKYKEKYNN